MTAAATSCATHSFDRRLLRQALRRDPPALVVADRRALAAFRACNKLRLRCVVNNAGLLGDLDRPSNAIPAPFTGKIMAGFAMQKA